MTLAKMIVLELSVWEWLAVADLGLIIAGYLLYRHFGAPRQDR